MPLLEAKRPVEAPPVNLGGVQRGADEVEKRRPLREHHDPAPMLHVLAQPRNQLPHLGAVRAHLPTLGTGPRRLGEEAGWEAGCAREDAQALLVDAGLPAHRTLAMALRRDLQSALPAEDVPTRGDGRVLGDIATDRAIGELPFTKVLEHVRHKPFGHSVVADHLLEAPLLEGLQIFVGRAVSSEDEERVTECLAKLQDELQDVRVLRQRLPSRDERVELGLGLLVQCVVEILLRSG
mmetsp:Transcript_51805/g.149382  ORF Transcript_51805/g.149382 Transcript_51805/m.149382 type:complete len:237 (-) Transcript_51805:93-803(-)